MDRELPSIWRTYRVFFLIVWITTFAAVAYVVWDLGGISGLQTSWVPASLFLLAGAVVTAGSVVPALRARRALRVFQETVPGPTEVGRGGEMVLRWTDRPLEVRGAVGFLFILWHMKLRMPGEEWTFDTSAASIAARYARERLQETPPAVPDRVRRVPWGLAQWMPWGVVLFVAVFVGGTFRLAGLPHLFLPTGIAVALLGSILLLEGRVRTRTVIQRLIDALRSRGLHVDGPYVVESGPAVRYVLFTDQGPLNVQPVVIGHLGVLHACSGGSTYRTRPDNTEDLAEQMVRRTAAVNPS